MSLILACAILSAVTQNGLPDQSLPALQKAVVERYARIDHYSVSCLLYVKDVYAPAQLCMGGIDYRFDRRTKRLAVGSQQQVGMLIRDDRLLLLACRDESEDALTYLEIRKDHTITWKDVDEARQLLRKECPLADGSYRMPCFVWPFLDGGGARLFPPTTKLLKQSNAKQGKPIQKELDPFAAILDFGHPDYQHILVPKDRNNDTIDPKHNPICTMTEDGVDQWAFAFERASGTMTAAIGIVDRKQVLGTPGNKLLVLLKRIATFGENDKGAGEFRPLPLDLPQNARTVGLSGLKTAYYTAMAHATYPSLAEQNEQVERALLAAVQKRNRLEADLAKSIVTSGTERDRLADLRRQLDATRGDIASCSYVNTQLKRLIAEVRRKKIK
jgi:hypothetical protein